MGSGIGDVTNAIRGLSDPNVMGPQPSGLSGGEWATRIFGKGLQGGLQGYANQQGQAPRQGGSQFAPQAAQAPVQLPIVQPKKPGTGDQGGGSYNPFYGA